MNECMNVCIYVCLNTHTYFGSTLVYQITENCAERWSPEDYTDVSIYQQYRDYIL